MTHMLDLASSRITLNSKIPVVVIFEYHGEEVIATR